MSRWGSVLVFLLMSFWMMHMLDRFLREFLNIVVRKDFDPEFIAKLE
ncbi:Uncharacterised protein [Bartonella quintana]|nr:hypothetical protein Q647_00504 [Bartonella quintana JK 7]KEC62484.1 hypothetical protein O7Y_00521 [Bartonella quintana JK 63]KEC67192.1 hypothetical protein O7S_00092 [Bartonella quintana JK 67]SQF95019.1 Uncharacterised protein [Bartonella quintana]